MVLVNRGSIRKKYAKRDNFLLYYINTMQVYNFVEPLEGKYFSKNLKFSTKIIHHFIEICIF